MNKKYNRIKNYLPFVVLTLLMLFHHLITKQRGDDNFFAVQLQKFTLFEVLYERYTKVTPRSIIEFFLIPISNKMFVWKILNAGIFFVLSYSISKLFLKDKKDNNSKWILIGLILIYPLDRMSSAGWMATTMNYLWTLSLGLLSFIPIKKVIDKEKTEWFEYILYSFALLYASNHEQMMFIVLSYYTIFLIYFLSQKEKNIKYIFVQFVLAILSAIFVIFSPGNRNRSIFELKWFPDFNMISFVDKIEIAYSRNFSRFVFTPQLVFFVFTVLIFICAYCKYKDKFLRTVSAIPLFCSSVFGVGLVLSEKLFNKFNPFPLYASEAKKYGIVDLNNKNFVPAIILGICFICLLLSIYIVFHDNVKKKWLMLSIVCIGIMSCMVLAFSPTIWVSGDRTHIFIEFSFIITSFVLYQEIKLQKFKYLSTINVFIACIAVLNYINQLLMLF